MSSPYGDWFDGLDYGFVCRINNITFFTLIGLPPNALSGPPLFSTPTQIQPRHHTELNLSSRSLVQRILYIHIIYSWITCFISWVGCGHTLKSFIKRMNSLSWYSKTMFPYVILVQSAFPNNISILCHLWIKGILFYFFIFLCKFWLIKRIEVT